jgi:hypothetical protein
MTNKEYLKNRKIFADSVIDKSFFDIVDHWTLYCGIQNMARYLYIYDVFKEIANVPGDLAEFGSWRGSNVVFLAKLLSIFQPISDKKVHCFEGFEGLSTFHEKDGNQSALFGKYKGNHEELLKIITLYGLNEKLLIHKGLIQDTVPDFVESNPESVFSFLYFDADLYEPAKIMLDNFSQRLSVNGVILFDEWNTPEWPGETRAVTEFLDNNKNFEMIQPEYTKQPTLLLRKIF